MAHIVWTIYGYLLLLRVNPDKIQCWNCFTSLQLFYLILFFERGHSFILILISKGMKIKRDIKQTTEAGTWTHDADERLVPDFDNITPLGRILNGFAQTDWGSSLCQISHCFTVVTGFLCILLYAPFFMLHPIFCCCVHTEWQYKDISPVRCNATCLSCL